MMDLIDLEYDTTDGEVLDGLAVSMDNIKGKLTIVGFSSNCFSWDVAHVNVNTALSPFLSLSLSLSLSWPLRS